MAVTIAVLFGMAVTPAEAQVGEVPGGSLPFQVVGIEVNQVVQNFTNTVPMVRYKPTVVRVHVQRNPNYTFPSVAPSIVGGALFAIDLDHPSQWLSPPVLSPHWGGAVIPSKGIARDQLNSSLYFELPSSWHKTNLRFRVVVPNASCHDQALPTANDCMVDMSFNTASKPDIEFVMLGVKDGSGSYTFPTEQEVTETKNRVLDAMPVHKMRAEYSAWKWRKAGTPKLGEVLDWLRVLQYAQWSYDRYYETPNRHNTIYHAIIPGNGNSFTIGLGTLGKAYYAQSGAAVSASFLQGKTATPYSSNNGRNVAPHEIGHNIGSEHAGGWCGEKDFDKDFPWFGNIGNRGARVATLGPLGSRDAEMWGVTPRLFPSNTPWPEASSAAPFQIVSPYKTFEIMSYCYKTHLGQDSWPSVSTYAAWQAFWEVCPYEPYDLCVPVNAVGLGLVVRGFVVGNEAELTGVVSVPEAPLPTGRSGTHEIVVRDRGGLELSRTAFTPEVLHGFAEGDGMDLISAVIPDPGVPLGRVEVVKDGAVIGSMAASAHAPAIMVVNPGPGAIVDEDEMRVAWSATDADGDELMTIVQYSTDGGATYRALAADVTESEIVIPRSRIPGGQDARVRVMVTDGVNTATAVSEPFSVTDSPPGIELTRVADGATFAEGQAVLIDADANDSEDGDLSDAVTWTSDLDGPLGTGFELAATDLSPGQHTIKASVSDSAGHQATASRSITVGAVPQGGADIVGVEVSGGTQVTAVAPLTSGNVEIETDRAGRPTRIWGNGTQLGANGTTTVAFQIQRIGTLPLYVGKIDYVDPGGGIRLSTPIFTTSMRSDVSGSPPTTNAGGNMQWFDRFFKPYRLTWSVSDVT